VRAELAHVGALAATLELRPDGGVLEGTWVSGALHGVHCAYHFPCPDGGALIVFDAATFKELKRIPMDKPVGKYNLYNKINRSEGTSH
jgi:hypothetical protein